MKKLLFLLMFIVSVAHADIFMLPEKSDILYDNAYSLNEYLISDWRNDCVLHYLSPNKIPDGYTAKIINETYPDSCLEKGFANIRLFDAQYQLVAVLNGYFTDGFFIGDLPLNAHVVKRFSDQDENQYLFFLLDEDRQMSIRYLGLMRAVKENDEQYTAFDACYPFEITLQTSNKALFKNQETLKNLTGVVQNYAQTLCPSETDIVMHASDSPSLDPTSVYFTQYLKSVNGGWKIHTVLPLTEQEKTSVKREDVIAKNIQSNGPTKVAQSTTEKTAEQLLDASIDTKSPVSGSFAIHVSKKASHAVVFADKPFIMKSFGNELNLKTGWYYVTATLKPMDDFEKKRSGIALKEKAAVIVIEKAVPCNLSFCQELRQ